MAKLAVFIGLVVALLAGVAAFDWRVDPYGDLYKPAALTDALKDDCLVSQELVGARYFPFKLDVFHRRPTRTIVVGSSRVLKIAARPGERTFANVGYPGTTAESVQSLFDTLPAKPALTVYLGVEAFWFNRHYVSPNPEPSDYKIAQYLLSRVTFEGAYRYVREAPYILTHRWRRDRVGDRCVIGRQFPAIAWNTDGSRVWSWELDPARFGGLTPQRFENLATWRSGYYDQWNALDRDRLAAFDRALADAQARGWRVVGFAPPEPAASRRILETDPRVAPRWHEFLRLMPVLFRGHGFTWAGLWNLDCPARDFPDAFHTDAACSARVRRALDAAARR